MRKKSWVALPVCAAILCSFYCSVSAQSNHRVSEHGVYNVHLLLHNIGTEEYTVTDLGGGRVEVKTDSETSDRGMKRISHSLLILGTRFEPLSLRQSTSSGTGQTSAETEVSGRSVRISESAGSRVVSRPSVAFFGAGGMPASVEMMMMRYWNAHGRPARLQVLRGSDKALPVEIRVVGHDSFMSHGKMVRLTRYTVANLVFGREILWMNDSNRLVAVMTFAGGLPQESVLNEYESDAGELFHNAVQQEMLNLADLGRRIKPVATGSYAITGVRLIDGTGRPPIEHATVVVRNGRIMAAGANVVVPPGTRLIREDGKSLLPGLWEMHSHYSGVEFGPALLSAGITTARDCGGEKEFLLALRQKIDNGALGPRLLLAGLVDSGGPLAFGAVDVKTTADGIAAVDSYADAGFEQIKVYTQLQPAVLTAISAEAHRRGMTVTGHVPAAVNSTEGIDDGMDQINHLQFVTREFTNDGKSPVDAESDRAKRFVALLKARNIVVDPTIGWGEMASHPKSIAVQTFEPGNRKAPWTLAGRFDAMGSSAPTAAGAFDNRMKSSIAVVKALHEAGVPIVAGSDTGLIGYGIDRELELYVQAGMTPLEAIQTATIVPARVMKLDKAVGTVEVGKDADLMIVDGDPSIDISAIRNVDSVVRYGRMYDAKKMGALVDFNR